MFDLNFYANILLPYLQTLIITAKYLLNNSLLDYKLKGFKKIDYCYIFLDIEFIRKLLLEVLKDHYLNENDTMLEALNSDSIYNSIKFFRLENIVSKEGIQIIDFEKLKSYIKAIEEILTIY